ncbi:MAG TPA: hypothetical protein PLC42_02420 [Parachlamydiaceae bacterium]|nr:hypothetical protein [Parachlamydiaceae bacterium]
MGFIFEKGIWIGEGQVKFSTGLEQIHFYTKWEIKALENGEIHCKQQVEMRGGGENVTNRFIFSNIQEKRFLISIENDVLGKAQGSGIADEKKIAWEFRDHADFEGFEVYELQENGDYLLHAEYISEEHRTTIDGRIWKKNK